MADIYFWRQIFILTTAVLSTLTSGVMVAFPSVLFATNITDIEVTKNQQSWITTSNGIAGIFGFFVLPFILQILGRKAAHITGSLMLLIGWIIFALAHSATALLIARIIQGIVVGSLYTQAIIISEYVSPKNRGCFMISKKSAVAVGIFMCHALSLIWNWRQIAIFAIIFPTLGIVLTLFWPESPYYLAMKGRYKESEKSFVWLHGASNMKELYLLHSSLQRKVKNSSKEKWHKFLFKKDFLKSFLIVCLATFILEFSGKHFFTVYVIKMMLKLLEDKSLSIYVSLGADSFIFVALFCSAFVIRRFKRRTILFSFGALTVALMLVICLVIIMKSPNTPWLAPALIVLHSFIVNISIIPVCYTLFGEIIPLEYISWGSFLSGIVFVSSYTMILTFTPVLIESAGVSGCYGIYGISIAVSLVVLYDILPETKDRTLQEIANEIKGIELPDGDDILPKS